MLNQLSQHVWKQLCQFSVKVVFTNLFSAMNHTEEMCKQFTILEKHLGLYHNYISHSILSISVPAGLMTQQQNWWFILDSRQKEQVLIVPSQRKIQSRVYNLTKSFRINYNNLRFHQNTPVTQALLETEAHKIQSIQSIMQPFLES